MQWEKEIKNKIDELNIQADVNQCGSELFCKVDGVPCIGQFYKLAGQSDVYFSYIGRKRDGFFPSSQFHRIDEFLDESTPAIPEDVKASAEKLFPIKDDMSENEKYIQYSKWHGFERGVAFAGHAYKGQQGNGNLWAANLWTILQELVELKDLKDTRGKTDDYNVRRTVAWELARRLTKEFKQEYPIPTSAPLPSNIVEQLRLANPYNENWGGLSGTREYEAWVKSVSKLRELLSSQPGEKDYEKDEFIQKHLKIIRQKLMDGMIESHIVNKRELLKGSLQHFLSGGNCNGLFRETILGMLTIAYNWKPQPLQGNAEVLIKLVNEFLETVPITTHNYYLAGFNEKLAALKQALASFNTDKEQGKPKVIINSNLPTKEQQEEMDNFAIRFAVWCIGPEGEMYRATGMSAGKLLDTYKSRPYIDIYNPLNQ